MFTDEQRNAIRTAANTLANLCDTCVQFYGAHERVGDKNYCAPPVFVNGETFTPHPEADILYTMIGEACK